MAAPAPETDQIFELVEGFVELFVGDFAIAPFSDLGLGAPSTVTESEPELGVVTAERDERL